MRLAIADPPYLGRADLWYGAGRGHRGGVGRAAAHEAASEWDDPATHRRLVARLEAEYDGWDAMLALVRQRQQDREDRRALERMGLAGKDKDKEKKSKSKTSTLKTTTGPATLYGEENASIMDIAYTKQGAVREWDLGKEGF